jgi:hypothetical protein
MAIEEGNKKEPALKFLLKIDNEFHDVSLDSDHDLIISGKPHRVRIELNPVRNFEKAGISFNFDAKRHFSYEALSPLVDHWSLDGDSSVIMVQNYKVKIEKADIIESFEGQYRKMKAKTLRSKIKLQYDNKNINGVRLLIKMGKIKLEQQLFFFNKPNTSRVLILQDTFNDDNSNTEEFVKMRKLIQASLSIVP